MVQHKRAIKFDSHRLFAYCPENRNYGNYYMIILPSGRNALEYCHSLDSCDILNTRHNGPLEKAIHVLQSLNTTLLRILI